jgi:apolipoprotein N-acyltransferase
MACGALTLMGDAVLMGLVAAVISLRAGQRRDGALVLLALATWAMAAHLGQGWPTPQAMAFVDRVLQSGLEHSLVIGLALALLQMLLLWPALRHRQARLHGLVWGLLVALSLPGWLPSPLVGFGGSFIFAYLLSLALVSGNAVERLAPGSRLAAARSRRRPRSWPRSGLT